MKKIEIEKHHGFVFVASYKDRKETGRTEFEAIGKLILRNKDLFEVEAFWSKTPLGPNHPE